LGGGGDTQEDGPKIRIQVKGPSGPNRGRVRGKETMLKSSCSCQGRKTRTRNIVLGGKRKGLKGNTKD